MKQSDCRENRKLQFYALILLCFIGGYGCGESGSSTPSGDLLTQAQDDASVGLDTGNQNVPIVLRKSAGPRKEVCWKGKSRLKEIELQKLRKIRHRKLDCNLITRRALAVKEELLALK